MTRYVYDDMVYIRHDCSGSRRGNQSQTILDVTDNEHQYVQQSTHGIVTIWRVGKVSLSFVAYYSHLMKRDIAYCLEWQSLIGLYTGLVYSVRNVKPHVDYSYRPYQLIYITHLY